MAAGAIAPNSSASFPSPIARVNAAVSPSESSFAAMVLSPSRVKIMPSGSVTLTV